MIKFLPILLFALVLSGCAKPYIAGPENVPGTSKHIYNVRNCTNPTGWSVTGGTLVGATGSFGAASIHWGAGPNVGTVSVNCKQGPVTLSVNVVNITNAGDVFDASKPVKYLGQEKIGEKKHIAGLDPAAGGVIWGANIAMKGKGQNKITVGFVQILRKIPVWQGIYAGAPSPLNAKFRRKAPWVDSSTPKSPPIWYDNQCLSQGKGGPIPCSDAPATGWLATNKKGHALLSGTSHWKFDTYLVAQTSDAPHVNTILGELSWDFIANIKRDEQGKYTVTGKATGPKKRPAGQLLPPYFTPVTSGKTVLPSTGISASRGITAPNRTFK